MKYNIEESSSKSIIAPRPIRKKVVGDMATSTTSVELDFKRKKQENIRVEAVDARQLQPKTAKSALNITCNEPLLFEKRPKILVENGLMTEDQLQISLPPSVVASMRAMQDKDSLGNNYVSVKDPVKNPYSESVINPYFKPNQSADFLGCPVLDDDLLKKIDKQIETSTRMLEAQSSVYPPSILPSIKEPSINESSIKEPSLISVPKLVIEPVVYSLPIKKVKPPTHSHTCASKKNKDARTQAELSEIKPVRAQYMPGSITLQFTNDGKNIQTYTIPQGTKFKIVAPTLHLAP